MLILIRLVKMPLISARAVRAVCMHAICSNGPLPECPEMSREEGHEHMFLRHSAVPARTETVRKCARAHSSQAVSRDAGTVD